MTREELLSVDPEAYRPVPVALSRGRTVLVRALDGAELFQARRVAGAEDFYLALGLFGVCDGDGRRLLTADDYPAFVRQGFDACLIGRKVAELSGIEETVDAAKKG